MNHIKKFELFSNIISPQSLVSLNVINSILKEIDEELEETKNCSNETSYFFNRVSQLRTTWKWIEIYKNGHIIFPVTSQPIISQKKSIIPITWEDRKWFRNFILIEKNENISFIVRKNIWN